MAVTSLDPPDFVFPIWRDMIVEVLSIYRDPLTGESVDEKEACRRQLFREMR